MSQKVIRVRNQDGAEFDIDDPREGTSARDEVLNGQLAKGDLVVVEDAKPAPKPRAAKSEA